MAARPALRPGAGPALLLTWNPRSRTGPGSTEAAATAFDDVADDDWQRTERRSNGATFTIEALGTYFIHDLTHHLHDVPG